MNGIFFNIVMIMIIRIIRKGEWKYEKILFIDYVWE